jgi:GNAT superfamily N-acetyltransferase
VNLVAACRGADAAEAAACVDMYAAAPAGLISSRGLRVESIAGATLLLAPGLATPMFNRVIGFGTFEPATEAALDAIVARYRAAGVGTFWISINAAAAPQGIAGWLEARGAAPPTRRSWVQMRWPAATPPVCPTTLHVETAGASDARELGAVVASAFGMPESMTNWLESLVVREGWRGYAARTAEEGRIVGGGFVHMNPPLAWLGMGAVAPSHRGHNGQRALMAARIAHALDAGCVSIHTETGEPIGDEPNPSLANMRRCGFERIASRVNYALSPGAALRSSSSAA